QRQKKFNSPNDIIVGPDGASYFTDPTLDLPKGEKQEIPFQGVYRLDDNGHVRLLNRELPRSELSRALTGWKTILRQRHQITRDPGLRCVSARRSAERENIRQRGRPRRCS